MSQAEQAFEIVKRSGLAVRSSLIAQRLDCTPANVHELLLPYVQRGQVMACDVEAGGERLKDYRLAVASGGAAPEIIYSGRPPQPPKVTTFAFGREADEPKPAVAPAPRPQSQQPKKETATLTIADSIEAAFKKHGPMTTRELRKHVKGDAISTIVAQYARSGRFAALGGGERTTVFGMPYQKLSGATRESSPPPPPPKKNAGGNGRVSKKRRAAAAAERRAEGARLVAGRFRPAIAHDGALLLTGARQSGELDSAETRVLADFLARIDRTGVRA